MTTNRGPCAWITGSSPVIPIPLESFVWPPMEVGVGFDDVGLIGEGGASSVEDIGEIVEGFDGLVGEGLVGERPQTLGRLEFGRVRRQEAQMEAFGYDQFLADMPSGVVEHHDDRLVLAGAGGAREGIEDGLEERHVDRIGDPPFHIAGCRAHEGVEIEPFVFMVTDGDGALSGLCPDAPGQRLQAETVLVESPDLDRPVGRPRRVHRLAGFFLKTALSSGPAALACRGRGRCSVKPSRCR